MNPFEWRGPEFLVFYLCLAIASGVLVFLLRVAREARRNGGARPLLTDPYEIGYLREGPAGAISVAMLALIERGTLRVDDHFQLVAVAPDPHQPARRMNQLERALAGFFSVRGTAETAFEDEAVKAATAEQAAALDRHGLLPDFGYRLLLTGAALFVLAAVAITKIVIALSAGRHNIGYLLLLWAAASVAMVLFTFSNARTLAGTDALSDLLALFPEVPSISILPRENPEEFILLAAVHGVADAPSRAIGGKRLSRNAWAAASGCGSGGSNCGSGGCGGGGGCGGCGS